MAENNKLEEMIKASLESIKTVVDADTVIGTAILTAPGTTIIPVSRISVGFASGGVDYNGKHHEAGKAPNFGGGGGTGMSVTPVGFLVVDAGGNVSFLAADGNNAKDPICQIAELIEKAPSALEKIKSAVGKFAKKKHKKENGSSDVDDLETPDAVQEDENTHE